MLIKYFTDEDGLDRLKEDCKLWVWRDSNIEYNIECPIYIPQRCIDNPFMHHEYDNSIVVFAKDCVLDISNQDLPINK